MPEVNEEIRKQYQDRLRFCREKQSPTPIANRYPWQGELAICELVKLALSKQKKGEDAPVRILTGSAPDHVYGRKSRDLWKEFLDAGGKVLVLVWGDSLEGCGGVLREFAAEQEGVVFRLSGTRDKAESVMHCLAVGKSAYRLEAAHKPFEEDTEITDYSPEVPARICFGDADGAEQLVNNFDELWNSCAVPA